MKPVNFIGMINDYTGIRDIEIGEIEVKKTFSFFETDKSYTKEILAAFENKFFKKREINVEITTSERKGNQSDRRGRRKSGRSDKPWMKQGRKPDRSKKENRKSR